MITKRKWLRVSKNVEWSMEGWFLFNFIPLYIRDTQPRARIKD